MLKHGYTDQDEQPDRDNSHEYRGHGVSQAWIKKRVTSGAKTASKGRLINFSERMSDKARDHRHAEWSSDRARGRKFHGRRAKKYETAARVADRAYDRKK